MNDELTVPQPTAALIAAGIITVIATPKPAPRALHGQTIHVRSSRRRIRHGHTIGQATTIRHTDGPDRVHHPALPDGIDVAYDTIVATVRLVDSVPILHFDNWGGRLAVLHERPWRTGIWLDDTDITDQTIHGDFTPGRWAWLIDTATLIG